MKEQEIPGMSIEEIRALYFNRDALREPAYKVFQINADGHRYYYRPGEAVLYPSVTTLLKQVLPTSPFLLEWMLANGKDGSIEKRDTAAAYGTFMHGQFERLLIERKYDFDSAPSVLAEYMMQNNLPESLFPEWAARIRKDVLAFAQFVRDWNVKPLAIEVAMVHPDSKYAGCIDLPCEMTDPKKGETFRAIVDFKSGRKGFYEEQELQLHLYRETWNVNEPDLPIERVFNFAPKDWRKRPTYNLKEQTGAKSAQMIPHLLALAALRNADRDNTVTIIHGVLDLDSGRISDNVMELPLVELIKSRKEKSDAPEGTKETDAPGNGPETAIKPTNAPKMGNYTSDGAKVPENENTGKITAEDLARGLAEFAKNGLLNDEIEL